MQYTTPDMRWMQRVFPILLVAFCVLADGAAAQTLPTDQPREAPNAPPPFSLGDQYLGLSAGGYFPLLLIDPSTGQQGDPNQNIGGQVGLQWGVYLNAFFSVGIETAYIFSNTPNSELLSLWPTAIQFFFAPRVGQFIIPVHIDVGIILNYYRNTTWPSLLLRGGLGFYWFFDPSWGVGIDAEYYFAPQLHAGPTPPPADNRLLNSIVASFGVIYRL